MTTPEETPSTSLGTIALSQPAASNRPIVMPEEFSAAGSEEWDSWLSHFEDCSVIINEWSDHRNAQSSRRSYAWDCVAPAAESVARSSRRLHKSEEGTPREIRPERVHRTSQGRIPCRSGKFSAKARRKSLPGGGCEFARQSCKRSIFINALEDREIRMKIRESGPKTLDEAVSCALQIEAMYEAGVAVYEKSVGSSSSRATTRREKRPRGTTQAEYSRHEPDGPACTV